MVFGTCRLCALNMGYLDKAGHHKVRDKKILLKFSFRYVFYQENYKQKVIVVLPRGREPGDSPL